MINPNIQWSFILAQQFRYLDIEDIVICSGSRNSPLTLAFNDIENFNCHSFIDERSAAFFAIGLAKNSNKPVILISTSGTAVGNFYPAIMEAKHANIPLIVITADRSHEERLYGANQTTDQIKIYGDKVKWFVDLATPSNLNAVDVKLYLKKIAAQAYEHSMFDTNGPVHINFPFRKPLEPTQLDLTEYRIDFKPIKVILPEYTFDSKYIKSLIDRCTSSSFPILLLGPDAHREISKDVLTKFVSQLNLTVFVDPLSGFKSDISDRFILNYDVILSKHDDLPTPDLIIQIGMMPISSVLQNWLSKYKHDWIIISNNSNFRDSISKSNIWYKAHPNSFFSQTPITSIENEPNQSVKPWIEKNQFYSKYLDVELKKYPNFEGSILFELMQKMTNCQLIIGNSSIPRLIGEFISKIDSSTVINSMRGLSGIDGMVSYSLGHSLKFHASNFLLIGDLSFIHDLNSLLFMKQNNISMHIVIINNNGGGIFERLPISKFDPPYEKFLFHKHNLNFENIAKSFNIPYLKIESMTKVSLDSFNKNIVNNNQSITEILTNAKTSEKIRRELLSNKS